MGNFEAVNETPDFVGKWSVAFYGTAQRRCQIMETDYPGHAVHVRVVDDISEAYKLAASHNEEVLRKK